MVKILFICHGNICRSPISEFVFKDLVKKEGLEEKFLIDSKATSKEEIGNDLYPPAKRILTKYKIPFERHYASQVLKSDYEKYDFLIIMDNYNYTNLLRIIGDDKANKVIRFLDLTPLKKDISDPWYTGDFETTFHEITLASKALLSLIKAKNMI